MTCIILENFREDFKKLIHLWLGVKFKLTPYKWDLIDLLEDNMKKNVSELHQNFHNFMPKCQLVNIKDIYM